MTTPKDIKEATLTFENLLAALNSETIHCVDDSWEENIPDDIWNEYFDGQDFEVVGDINEYVEDVTIHNDLIEKLEKPLHRWYSTSITVVKIFGRFIGIRNGNNPYCEFFEMQEVKTVTYTKINSDQ